MCNYNRFGLGNAFMMIALAKCNQLTCDLPIGV